MKSLFEKGGKLERLAPIYDMIATILFVFPERTKTGVHVRDYYDIKRLMSFVIIAGLPAFFFGMYNTGLQHFLSMGQRAGFMDYMMVGASKVLPLLIVAYAAGGFWEVLFAVIRRHEVNEGFLVTGFLIPLIVPATIPLWQVAVATSFGVVIGKEVFGGTGMNVFNPALVTRAFLFFAYPSTISGTEVWTVFGKDVIDSYTKATPLTVAAGNSGTDIVQALEMKGYTLWDMFAGFIPGSVGETSALALLIGLVILIITGVASWRVIFSTIAGGLAMGYLLNAVAPGSDSFLALPAYYHLVMGGFAFGAVFMATDPVSSAQTNTGKYIYGFLIGVLTVLVRALNPAYPEGMMLAILFMNAFAPLIDNVVVWQNIKRRQTRAAK